jgi:hypothetical protein
MGLPMDPNAVYGFSFETLRAEHSLNLPSGYSHGLSDEDVAGIMGIDINEVSVENTIRAVIKVEYPELALDYTGVIYGDVTVIYVRESKITAPGVPIQLAFPHVGQKGKDQLETLAKIFGETPDWIMYATVPLEYINTMGES